MSQKSEVQYRGVTVGITTSRSAKKGVVYESFQVADYSSGKRKRWTFADAGDARQKAREIAELMASGQPGLLALSPYEQAIRSAMEALTPTATKLDQAAYIFADACKYVEPHEIVAACRYYRDHRASQKLDPVTLNEAAGRFLAQWRAGAKRKTGVAHLLEILGRKFGNRVLHEIERKEIDEWVNGREWSNRSVNDFMQAAGQFWWFAVNSGYAAINPLAGFKRLRVPRGCVKIYTPDQLRQQLYRLCEKAPELVAAAAIGAFGGLRTSEIARLDWTQLNAALQTGFIELRGDQCLKTGEGRLVPVSDNLKAWLLACRKASGPVLPVEWTLPTRRHPDRLSELGRFIQRKTKVKWQCNGWRHSFGTFHFKLHGDAHATVLAMGNSLVKFERHYMNRSKLVTRELAAEHFAILPPDGRENVVPLAAAAA